MDIPGLNFALTMRLNRALAICVLTFQSLSLLGSAAATGEGWSARLSQSAQVQVIEGDLVVLDCLGSMPDVAGFAGPGGAAIFIDMGFEDWWFTQLAEVSRDVAVTSSGGPLEMNATTREFVPTSDGEQRIWQMVAHRPGLARAAWAVWGYDGQCSLSVNSITIPATEHATQSAVLYYSEDFDSSTSPTLGVRPVGESFGDSQMSRHVGVASFVFLGSGGWVSGSEVTATSSNGSVFRTNADTSSIILRGTDSPGLWSFSVTGFAAGPALPPVALIELPGYPMTVTSSE